MSSETKKKRKVTKKSTKKEEIQEPEQVQEEQEEEQEQDQDSGESNEQDVQEDPLQEKPRLSREEYRQRLSQEKITLNLQFVLSIRDVFSNIVPRVEWKANELYNIGIIIQNLNIIHNNFVKGLENERNENTLTQIE